MSNQLAVHHSNQLLNRFNSGAVPEGTPLRDITPRAEPDYLTNVELLASILNERANESIPLDKSVPFFFVDQTETFETHEDALAYCKALAAPLGFDIGTGRNTKPKYGRAKFICRMGHNSSEERQAEVSSTVKTGCKFAVDCWYRMQDDVGVRRWMLEVKTGSHNHARLPPSALPAHRKLSEAQMQTARELRDLGVPSIRILGKLRKEGSAILQRDLYALQHRMRTEEYEGKTATEAALKHLDQESDVYYAWVDHSSHLDGLLLSTHANAALTRAYGTVLMIDGTFRTNRFGMPALHFVAIANTGQSFTSAIIWMPAISEEAYVDAIKQYISHVLLGDHTLIKVIITDCEKALRNALGRLFPYIPLMLCQFHIIMNVSSKGQAGAGMSNEHWDPIMKYWKQNVLWAPTYYMRKAGMVAMRAEHQGPHLDTLYGYLDTLQGCQTFFLNSRYNQMSCHGHHTTSPAESSHRHLQTALANSRSGLLTMVTACKERMAHEVRQIMDAQVQDRVRVMQKLPGTLSTIARQLSKVAVKALSVQASKAVKHISDLEAWRALSPDQREGQTRPEMQPCTETFRNSMELPCSHNILATLQAGNTVTELEHLIGRYWAKAKEDQVEEWIGEGKTRYLQRQQPGFREQPIAILDPYLRFEQARYRNIGEAMTKAARVPHILPVGVTVVELPSSSSQATASASQALVPSTLTLRPMASTGRTLSQFENVRAETDRTALGKRKPSTCTACRDTGHNRRTCKKPENERIPRKAARQARERAAIAEGDSNDVEEAEALVALGP